MSTTTTMNEYIKAPMPKVNILRIRKLLETNYKVDHDLAEGIAEAIDTALQDQDTEVFATKADINELKSEIKDLKIEINYGEYRLLFRLGIGLGTLMISIGAALAWYIQFVIGYAQH